MIKRSSDAAPSLTRSYTFSLISHIQYDERPLITLPAIENLIFWQTLTLCASNTTGNCFQLIQLILPK